MEGEGSFATGPEDPDYQKGSFFTASDPTEGSRFATSSFPNYGEGPRPMDSSYSELHMDARFDSVTETKNRKSIFTAGVEEESNFTNISPSETSFTSIQGQPDSYFM